MFSVKLNQLTQIADKMAVDNNRFKRYEEEITNIKNVLPSLTVYEDEIAELSEMIGRVQETYIKYGRYIEALDEIVNGYNTCENKVADNLEVLRRIANYEKIEIIYLSEIKNMIDDVL